MNVIYSGDVRQVSEDGRLFRRANEFLEEVMRRPSAPVEVQWDRVEDERGRTLYELKLSDWIGSVSSRFTRSELESSSDLNYRIRWLYDDLLQIRSRHLLKVLTSGVESPEE